MMDQMETSALMPDRQRVGYSAALPLTFLDTVGLFMPASAVAQDIAVLIASPWGLEEMCTRKLWRVMAEKLADVGIASLRFDYPGTGDALDRDDFAGGLSLWEDSLVIAAERLQTKSGCKRVIIVSHGVGAIVASRAAPRIPALDAIIYMAPAVSGRAYLRETQMWSKLVDEGLGLSEAQRISEGVAIAGLILPGAIASDIRKIDLLALGEKPSQTCLVVARPDRPSDDGFARHLEALGADVSGLAYTGYDELVTNPSISRIPDAVVAGTTTWIAARGRPLEADHPPLSENMVVPLLGDGYRETPVRFGDHQRLSGVLCEPLGRRYGATVLLLGTAYDRHAGWGQAGIGMARALASDGIASLRFDGANVGDSPPVPGRSDQVLFDGDQNNDVSEAVDFLETRQLLPAVVSGRCSGGYLAFNSAVNDPRLRGAVVVNPYVFIWDPRRDVTAALRFVPRTLGTYKARLFKAETFQRLRHGRIDVGNAMKNIVKALGNRVSRFTGPLPVVMPVEYAVGQKVQAVFEKLAERKTAVSLIYSANDVGLEHFSLHFRPDGSRLKRFSNVRLAVIENADHNLSPASARKTYLDIVRDMALSTRP